MNRQQVAKTWIHYGLTDLYFAFDSDDAFSDNVLFSEIMGMEKFMKAVLLFHLYQEYEDLAHQDAKERINKFAKSGKMGHNFEIMFNDLSLLMPSAIARIMQSDFDGYTGSELIRAVYSGYMETRYPVPTRISDTFPKEDTEFTHNPLWSSGITKFIYAVCNACFTSLSLEIDFTDLISQFSQRFSHKESFQRFNNYFWEISPFGVAQQLKKR
jgi:hypothetical protein